MDEMNIRTAIKIEEDLMLKLTLEGACEQRELLINDGPIKVYKSIVDSIVLVTGTDPLKGSFVPFYIKDVPKFETKQTIIQSLGDQLVTRVVIPTEKNLKTTVLMRSPYHLASIKHLLNDYFKYARLGYNVIIQPVSGSLLNTGTFQWLNLEKEKQDAKATMDWIEKQPWSNGKVILIGTSYPGSLALAGASTNHRSIIGVVATSAPTNKNRHSLSKGGTVNGKLAYEIAVNSYIKNYERVWPALTQLEAKSNYNDTLKLLKETGFQGLDLQPISYGEKNQREHRDLINNLKVTSFPIVHSAGAFSDQDSIDSYENFMNLEEKENNYFILHPNGHSDVTESALLKIFSNEKQTEDSFTKMLERIMYRQKLCFTAAGLNFGEDLSVYNPLTRENCFNSSKDFESQFEKVTFKFQYSHDIQNGDTSIQLFKVNSSELGTFLGPIRIKVNHKERTQETVKTTDFTLLLKQKNLPQQSLSTGNISINDIGKKRSEATSNFTFFTHADHENEMTLYLIKRDNKTLDAKEKLEVESIELTLLKKNLDIDKIIQSL